MRRLRLMTSVLIVCIVLAFGVGCGRYGKPVRTHETKPEASAAGETSTEDEDEQHAEKPAKP